MFYTNFCLVQMPGCCQQRCLCSCWPWHWQRRKRSAICSPIISFPFSIVSSCHYLCFSFSFLFFQISFQNDSFLHDPNKAFQLTQISNNIFCLWKFVIQGSYMRVEINFIFKPESQNAMYNVLLASNTMTKYWLNIQHSS